MKHEITLHDWLTHFGDEFSATADILKKYRDLSNFEAYDSQSKPIKIKTIKDLKSFLESELDGLRLIVDEMDESEEK